MTVHRKTIANALGVTSLSTSFGALFLFGVFLQFDPQIITCDILAGSTIVSGIAAWVILPKKEDHRIIVSVLFGIIAAVIYFIGRP